MHTAFQLKEEQFAIEVGGKRATRADLFPNWGEYDRVGVIVDRDLGAIGCSLLAQLSITSFYDYKPSRREVVAYPELYFFHVGKRYGNHGYYDLYPPRKEVVTSSDPADVLDALNDRGITRLIVADGPAQPTIYHHTEPATAVDRLLSAYVYSPSGRVENADVRIAALTKAPTVNTSIILRPGASYAEQMRVKSELATARGGTTYAMPDNEVMLTDDYTSDDVPQSVRESILSERVSISPDGLPVETYRRVPVEEALRMLAPRV